MKYVIIGNGIAGVCAAEAIREIDTESDISMVGDETHPPYGRPVISHVLDGSVPYEKLSIRSANFYEKLSIKPVLSERVTRLNITDKQIRIGENRWMPFDKLLIASGADPRPIQADGSHLKNIFYLRTEKDVRQKLKVLSEVRQGLVLGGGLVGFKAAYALLKRGLSVTMLITSDYPLSMQVDKTAGKMILDELRTLGLKVEVGTTVAAFEGKKKVEAAVTTNGERIPCDMVVVGKGVLPAHGYISRDEIDIDYGILVDEHLETGVNGIYAAGDVAELIDIARQRRWVNAIWPEAAIQGRIAGLNMAGRPVGYPGSLSRNVMRVVNLDVLTIGLANELQSGNGRTTLSRFDARRKTYRRLIFNENLLIGAVMINHIEQGGVLHALIKNRIPVAHPHDALLDPGFNFRCLTM